MTTKHKRKHNPTRDRAVARAKELAPLLKSLDHLSAGAIALEFNKRGVPTPTEGASWHAQTILRTMRHLKMPGR